MHILVADDDPDLRALLALNLEEFGHSVTAVDCGAQAIDAIESRDVYVALLDWMMPGMDGLEVTRAIRKRRDAPYVYVILMTVLEGKRNFLAGMDAGADDFVNKPIDIDVLRARLRVAERVLALQLALSDRRSVLPICMYCSKVRDEADTWQRVDRYLATRARALVSHGLCPDCFESRCGDSGAT